MEFFRVRGRKVLGKRLRRKEMFIPYCATDGVSVPHTQVKKDNTVEVDAVSGATMSSEVIKDAVRDALRG